MMHTMCFDRFVYALDACLNTFNNYHIVLLAVVRASGASSQTRSWYSLQSGKQAIQDVLKFVNFVRCVAGPRRFRDFRGPLPKTNSNEILYLLHV